MKKEILFTVMAILIASFSFGQGAFYSETNWVDLDSLDQTTYTNKADSLALGTNVSVPFSEVISVEKYLGVPSRSGNLEDQYWVTGILNGKTVSVPAREIPCVADDAISAETVKVSLCSGFSWGDDEY